MKNLNLTKIGVLWVMLAMTSLPALAKTVDNPFATELGTFADVLVKGTVVDNADGSALVGASIQVKGTTRGTITDADGKFDLGQVNVGDTLVFSYMGYRTVEHVVISQTDGLLKVDIRLDFEIEIYGAVALSDEVYQPKQSAIKRCFAKVKSIF